LKSNYTKEKVNASKKYSFTFAFEEKAKLVFPPYLSSRPEISIKAEKRIMKPKIIYD